MILINVVGEEQGCRGSDFHLPPSCTQALHEKHSVPPTLPLEVRFFLEGGVCVCVRVKDASMSRARSTEMVLAGVNSC